MPKARHFHQMLREAREQAHQSTEVMAILLNMEEESYLAIERGERYPDTETLKRLCVMLEWNFYDVQRLVINEISARPAPTPLPANEAALEALQSVPVGKLPVRDGHPDTLGARLRQVREATGQTADIIAMLLNISLEHYQNLERGEAPTDALLRQISMVYDWNYYDLISLLRSQQAHTLQPRRVGNPFPGGSAQQGKLKMLLGELERLFVGLPEQDQQFAMTQLELVRDTIHRLRQAS